MNAKTKKILRWLPLLVLGGFIALAYAMGWHQALSFESLQAQKEGFQNFTSAHPFLSAITFLGAYIASVALSLPIATLLTLLGGFLFGKWLGTALVVTGATIGASILFIIAQTSLGASLREKAGGLYQKISDNMEENAAGYLLFMRLVPLFPFVLVNVVPALFNVSLRVFVLTTFFGIIPGSFVYVNLGETLGEISSLNDLVSGQTFLAFGLLGLFALLPTLYKQFKSRKAAALLIPILTILSTPANAGDYQKFIDLYDTLLEKHTRLTTTEGIDHIGVDYKSWTHDKRHQDAKDILLSQDPDFFETRNQKLAFWINAYNFLTIDLIIREEEEESIKNLGSLFSSPWEAHEWDIGGEDYTLDDIEHEVIRPLGEPRIHFAINCAAISCPDLRTESYKPEILNRQLNEQTAKTFNNKEKGLLYSETNQKVYVTKIMDWFEEDFNDGDLKSWLKTYKPEIISYDTEIEFLDYNWTLNSINEDDK